MSEQYYPSLSSLIKIDDLPEQLNFLQTGVNDLCLCWRPRQHLLYKILAGEDACKGNSSLSYGEVRSHLF